MPFVTCICTIKTYPIGLSYKQLLIATSYCILFLLSMSHVLMGSYYPFLEYSELFVKGWLFYVTCSTLAAHPVCILLSHSLYLHAMSPVCESFLLGKKIFFKNMCSFYSPTHTHRPSQHTQHTQYSDQSNKFSYDHHVSLGIYSMCLFSSFVCSFFIHSFAAGTDKATSSNAGCSQENYAIQLCPVSHQHRHPQTSDCTNRS